MAEKSMARYLFPAAVLILLAGGYFLTTKNTVAGEDYAMYFFRDGCHYCLLQEPIVEQLISEGYTIRFMDVGTYLEYAQEYGIQATPTFMTGAGAKRVGFTELDELRSWLDQNNVKHI